MTVRPLLGSNTRASRFFMPQSSWCEPFRKNPGAACGLSAAKRWPSVSASGIFADLEKCQRPDFDALARARVGRRGRIFEGGVGGPAGAAVFQRIVDLEYDRLLAPLAREPVPLVGGIVGDGIGLPDAVGIAALGAHAVVVG